MTLRLPLPPMVNVVASSASVPRSMPHSCIWWLAKDAYLITSRPWLPPCHLGECYCHVVLAILYGLVYHLHRRRRNGECRWVDCQQRSIIYEPREGPGNIRRHEQLLMGTERSECRRLGSNSDRFYLLPVQSVTQFSLRKQA